MVSDEGGKEGYVPKSRWKAYKALKAKFGSTIAAKIANKGLTKKARSAMARKGARTRKLKGK